MQEPERAIFLHKARSLNDAKRAIIKAQEDGNDAITTAPPYLKGRIINHTPLPSMDVVKTGGNRLERSMLEHLMNGECNDDIFIGLLEMIVPEWHQSRH